MQDKEPFTRPILNPRRNLRYIQALGLSKGIQTTIGALLVEDDGLQGKVDMLRRLSVMFRGKSQYAEIFFSLLGKDKLSILLTIERPIQVKEFVELRLLPTPTIWQYLLAGKVADLKTEQDHIKGGGFDKEIQLHRELEYCRFMFSEGYYSLSNFNNKPFVIDDGYILYYEREVSIEIDAIVADNREILTFIEGEADKGKVLVLYNDRYGTYYVGTFLTPLLGLNSNIRTSNIRVGSTHFDSREKFDTSKGKPFFMQPEIRKYIQEENPTIIVIDGTQVKGYPKERFPGAMTKIHADFESMGKYRTRYWIPGKGEIEAKDVTIGSWGYKAPERESSHSRGELVLVRATGLSQGLFDDVEDILEKEAFVFGTKGLMPGKYYDGTVSTLLSEIGLRMNVKK